MDENNIEHKILSLLDNDLFIRWIVLPTPELDLFWENEIQKDPSLGSCVIALKKLLKKIRIEEPVLSAEDKKAIWENIDRRTFDLPAKKTSLRNRWWVRTISVAAVLLIFVGGYLYVANENKYVEVDYTSLLNDVVVSDSANISLVLSGDKVVNIQEDSTNVIYDKNGRVKVDSENVDVKAGSKASLNQLIVPYGKMTSLVLSDGTKVWVNSGTKIIYPPVFDKSRREIYLVGEAFFDVAKDKDWPFVIKTDQMDVKVLGTSLNVSAYGDEDQHSVVLVTGAVNVTSSSLKGNYNIHPNQMFTVDIQTNKVGIQEVNVDNYISWVSGYLLMQSERLDHVLQKLERHYNQTISYNAQELAGIRVSGKLDMRGSLENALKYISMTVPISYTVNEKGAAVKYQPKK